MRVTAIVTAIAVAASAPAAFANADGAINARKAAMQLLGHYIGSLGAMAKGEVDFNAEAAQKLALSMQSVATIDQSTFWPQGSDNVAMPGKTRAKPEMWSNFPVAMEKNNAFIASLETLVASTGDIASLQTAMGGVGKGCRGCHENFRGPKN